jgi:hypothetical protein
LQEIFIFVVRVQNDGLAGIRENIVDIIANIIVIKNRKSCLHLFLLDGCGFMHDLYPYVQLVVEDILREIYSSLDVKREIETYRAW